jgi:GDP-L-fucose synthase
VILWGSGEPYREFLYVDDLAEACLFLLERRDANEIGEFINIGRGEDLKIKDLASAVQECVGFEGKINFDVTKPDGTPRKLLDVTRMRTLGWESRTSLHQGLQRTYEWYLDRLGRSSERRG